MRERVVQFGAGRGLVGILTQPTERRSDEAPDLLLLNSGIIHRVGSNRLNVELARALARQGVRCLRFDLSGIGDSDRRSDATSVRDAVQRDITDAIEYLRAEHGGARVALFGLCSGAFDAFRAAVVDARVAGAFMVDMPGPFRSWRHTLHHVRSRLLDDASDRSLLTKLIDRSAATIQRALIDRPAPAPPVCAEPADGYSAGARRASSRDEMTDQLDTLLARNARLFFVFTAGLELNYNHASQFRGVFPRAARSAGVSHAFLPDVDHAFGGADARSRIISLVEEWIVSEWMRRSDAA